MKNKIVIAVIGAIIVCVGIYFSFKQILTPKEKSPLIRYIDSCEFDLCSELGILGKTTETELLAFPFGHKLSPIYLGGTKRNVYRIVHHTPSNSLIQFKFDEEDLLRTVTFAPRSNVYLDEWITAFGNPNFVMVTRFIQSKWITIYFGYREAVVIEISIRPKENYYDEICDISFAWDLPIDKVSFVYPPAELWEMQRFANGSYDEKSLESAKEFAQYIIFIPDNTTSIKITKPDYLNCPIE